MPMLTDNMRKFLLAEDKSEYPKNVYYYRIKEYASRGIEDITILLKHLPEKYQQGVFTKETLKPLLEAMLHFEPQRMTEQKRKRVLRIAGEILEQIGQKARVLSPKMYEILRESKMEEELMIGIGAIRLDRS